MNLSAEAKVCIHVVKAGLAIAQLMAYDAVSVFVFTQKIDESCDSIMLLDFGCECF